MPVEDVRVVECWGIADYRPPNADDVEHLFIFDADDFGAEIGEDTRGGEAWR